MFIIRVVFLSYIITETIIELNMIELKISGKKTDRIRLSEFSLM